MGSGQRGTSGALRLALACALALGGAPARADSAAQGDRIVNLATVAAAELASGITSDPSIVTVRVPTPAALELLQYAPGVAGARLEAVVPGAYRSGAAAVSPYRPLAAPRLTGAPTALSLPASLPLLASRQFHAGDPLFIRVTDRDQDLDGAARDTLAVSVADDATGDAEVVLLTEDAPGSGVFTGYLPTARSASGSQPWDGVLQVGEKSVLTARYVDPLDPGDVASAQGVLDPANRVFDSRTGKLVDGAEITVVDVASGQPAAVLGDDGASAFPSKVTSGRPATDAAGRVYAFGPGEFRFPFLRPGTYRYDVKPPAGYSAPSKVADAALQAVPGAPFTLSETGSRGGAFPLDPGPIAHFDVPVDPISTALFVQKSAGAARVGVGELVSYQITVANPDAGAAAPEVRVVDVLPAGFRYLPGSARWNGARAADPTVSPDGRTLTFLVGALAPGATGTVELAVRVGAGAAVGVDATNLASATCPSCAASNVARAKVAVGDDFFSARTFLLGSVTAGDCAAPDAAAKGVEGVRVLLEDGTFVVSDRQGLFHFEGVRQALHVVQLALDSLPEGYEAVACAANDRFAGRAFSQFVEVQGDTLWRADFRLRARAAPAAAPAPPAAPEGAPPPPPSAPPAGAAAPSPVPTPVADGPPGAVALSLRHRLLGRVTVEFEARVRGAGAPMRGAVLEVTLPAGLAYERGSARGPGEAPREPAVEGAQLRFALGDLPPGFAGAVTFRAEAREGAERAAASARAEVSGVAPGGAPVRTPVAVNVLRVVDEEYVERLRLELRPHFPSFGVALAPEDVRELEALAAQLARAKVERIAVVGHTDSVPIAPRARRIYPDNDALSLARARAVGRFLVSRLRLREDQLELAGRGAREPVAGNGGEAGRARNRRVEVRAYALEARTRAALVSVQGESGEQRAGWGEAVRAPAPVPAAAEARPAPPPGIEAAVAAGGMPAPVASLVPPAAPALAAPIPPAAAPPSAPAPSTPPPAPPTPRAPSGLLSPGDGELLPERIQAVQVRLPSHLTPALSVDGVAVDPSRIGYRSEDHRAEETLYTYVGVDFGAKGPHALALTGTDPFGNVRVRQAATVIRTGEIASVRMVSAEGNVADGKTPVRVRLELRDAAGDPIRGATRLELREGNLEPPRRREDLPPEAQPAGRVVQMDRDGWVEFQPVTTSGSYRALLAAGGATARVETWARPKLRDWVLVGLAEGTVGYQAASGNVESLAAGDAKEDLYSDGRLAFYAKGQIKGQWLLTAAYDSARERSTVGNSLFQAIDPQTYFTVYGDATQQAYDAPSARKLYVKLEREQFYALFGDFETGLTVTELSRYSRKLNGVKTEWQGRRAELSAFAARTDKVYARDELPGDGTSGLYRLTRGPVTVNSETVTLVTRDRFRSEVVLSSRTLTRFIDYSIDYDGRALFFREPVPSRDLQFNPVTVVVEYEVEGAAAEDYTLGGRGGLKLLDDRLRVGLSAVHEGQGERRNDLVGADLRLQLGAGTGLRGEVARTESRSPAQVVAGDAFLAELTHASRALDARLYLREEEGGFGLGQQPLTELGTRKLGGEAAWHLDDRLTLSGQGYRQDTFSTGVERLFGEARLGYVSGPYAGYLGVLEANDRLADGTRRDSGQLTAGAKLLTLGERLQLGVDYAQSVLGNGSSDFPTRVGLHAEYRLTPAVTLLGAEELTWGDGAATQNTRLGLRSTLWKGASVVSSVERDLAENGERVFGTMGLRQTWQVSDAWKVDAGAERSQTVKRVGAYQPNPAVPPASGNVGGEDFTALTTGANYQVKHLVWDSRAELRLAESDARVALLTGAVLERGGGWAFSGRAQLARTWATSGAHRTDGDLRLGAVYRPAATRWILLNRLDWLFARGTAGAAAGISAYGDAAATDSWRLVDNLLANWRPARELQASMGYGAKYVRERLGGESAGAFTDQASLELRRDLGARFDFGLRGSLLHAWSAGQVAWSGGPSAGYSPATNLWLGLGFNFAGYSDRDFSSSSYTAFGPYLRMRLKFDQESVREAASWLNRQ